MHIILLRMETWDKLGMNHPLRNLFLSVLVLTGCAHTIRSLTYPPSFQYIPQEKLKSSMWKLAGEVSAMEKELETTYVSEETKQQKVLSRLDNIENTMIHLQKTESNHPMLDRYGNILLDSVRRSRLTIQQSKPNYFFATQLSGACKTCHGLGS